MQRLVTNKNTVTEDKNAQNFVSRINVLIPFYVLSSTFLGIFLTCFAYVKIRKKVGVKLKTIKFDI